MANRQARHSVDSDRLSQAARLVLEGEGLEDGSLSLAVVDDATMRDLNRKYLDHDYATDVLSFLLEQGPVGIEGEVIVSADTAARQAADAGWTTDQEMLLYVVHGTLHLAGYDDADAEGRCAMRAGERRYLTRLGIDATAAQMEGDVHAE